MLPLTPNRGSVTRPAGDTGDYEDDSASPITVGSGVRCVIVAPGGADVVVGGRKEVVDAVLVWPAAPALQHADLFTDDDTTEEYRIAWVRRRRGLGLDHQVAGLRAVKGAASG